MLARLKKWSKTFIGATAGLVIFYAIGAQLEPGAALILFLGAGIIVYMFHEWAVEGERLISKSEHLR